MSDLSDKTLDSRTKAIKDMVKRGGDYEVPKSKNMLSHLTNERALKDYRYNTARKLVKEQEDLLRNLAKVRQQMEQEEDHIGKTRDYYSGSREEKFGHTFDRADKLKRQRAKKMEKEMEEEYVLLPSVQFHSCEQSEEEKFNSNIQRLRSQVNCIANRYQETNGEEPPRYLYDPSYYPGANYVDQAYFSLIDEEPDYVYVDDNEVKSKSAAPKYLSANGNIYKLVIKG